MGPVRICFFFRTAQGCRIDSAGFLWKKKKKLKNSYRFVYGVTVGKKRIDY